ncbi:Uncharacterised protein [Bordetella trematum]|uniref:hypothetical protein n=1 Tax=Bordetella trematum TaxID=123899 RepID=UPI000798ED96|nr:hypothetical protein [Bordetella trematum]SAI62866.1 Uncharacterised protein [Bordetella trematum]
MSSTTYIPRIAGVTLAGDFPKLAVFSAPALPFADDLVSLHTYGLSNDLSRINYVDGQPDLGQVGAPQPKNIGVVCDRDNCFESSFIPHESGYTVLSFAKPIKNTTGVNENAFLASNHGASAGGVYTGDSCLFASYSGTPSYINQLQVEGASTGVRGRIDISNLDEDEWHVFASVIGGADSNVAVGRGGTLSWGSVGPSTPLTPSQSRALRLGGFYRWAGTNIGLNGKPEMYLSAIYRRKLSKDEVAQVYGVLHTSWAAAGLPGL